MNNNEKKLTFDDVANMLRKFIEQRPSIIRLMVENTNLIRGNQSIEWRIDPIKSTSPSTVLILNNFGDYFRIDIGYKYHLFDIYPDKLKIKMNYNEIVEFKNSTKFDNVYKQLADDLYYSLSTELELFDNSSISDTSLKSTIHDLIKEYEYAHRSNFRIDCRYVSNLNTHETVWKFSTPAKTRYQLDLKLKDASTDNVNRKEIWFDNVKCIDIRPDEYSSEIYIDYALLTKDRGEYTTHKDLIPHINAGLRKWFHKMRLEQDSDLQDYMTKISMETMKILDDAEKDEKENPKMEDKKEELPGITLRQFKSLCHGFYDDDNTRQRVSPLSIRVYDGTPEFYSTESYEDGCDLICVMESDYDDDYYLKEEILNRKVEAVISIAPNVICVYLEQYESYEDKYENDEKDKYANWGLKDGKPVLVDYDLDEVNDETTETSFNPLEDLNEEEIKAVASMGEKLMNPQFNPDDLSDMEKSVFNKITDRVVSEQEKFEDKLIDEYMDENFDDDEEEDDSNTANVVKSAQDIVNNYPEHEEQKFSMEDMVNFSVEILKAYLPSSSKDFVERFVNQVKGSIIMKYEREANNENDREV